MDVKIILERADKFYKLSQVLAPGTSEGDGNAPDDGTTSVYHNKAMAREKANEFKPIIENNTSPRKPGWEVKDAFGFTNENALRALIVVNKIIDDEPITREDRFMDVKNHYLMDGITAQDFDNMMYLYTGEHTAGVTRG